MSAYCNITTDLINRGRYSDSGALSGGDPLDSLQARFTDTQLQLWADNSCMKIHSALTDKGGMQNLPVLESYCPNAYSRLVYINALLVNAHIEEELIARAGGHDPTIESISKTYKKEFKELLEMYCESPYQNLFEGDEPEDYRQYTSTRTKIRPRGRVLWASENNNCFLDSLGIH